MKRLLKLAVVAWLIGEWWTRGGRETVLGDGIGGGQSDSLNEFTVELASPDGWDMSPIVGRKVIFHGNAVGIVVSGNEEKVSAVFQRSLMGWPIHVAVSQAEKALAELIAAVV